MKINRTRFFIIMIGFVLLANMQALMAEQRLGRLFTSQAHRAELNNLRQNQPPNTTTVNIDSDKTSYSLPVILPMRLPSAIIMQGFVKRTDGKKSTVWINHQAVQENESLNGIEIGKLSRHSNQVPIKLTNNGKNISLKPGQVYNPIDDSVNEISAAVHGEGASESSEVATPKPVTKE